MSSRQGMLRFHDAKRASHLTIVRNPVIRQGAGDSCVRVDIILLILILVHAPFELIHAGLKTRGRSCRGSSNRQAVIKTPDDRGIVYLARNDCVLFTNSGDIVSSMNASNIFPLIAKRTLAIVSLVSNVSGSSYGGGSSCDLCCLLGCRLSLCALSFFSEILSAALTWRGVSQHAL